MHCESVTTSGTLLLSNLIKNLVNEFTGKSTGISSIIKINDDNHKEFGDLFFITSIKAWRDYIQEHCSTFTNIFEYYLYRKNKLKDNDTDEEIINKVSNLLMTLSKDWTLRIAKCCLRNNQAYIFLDRPSVIQEILKVAIQQGDNYGRNALLISKSFKLEVDKQEDSNLSYERLKLIRDVTSNILQIQGYKVVEDDKITSDETIIFTTKSQGKKINDKQYLRYVCGVVTNGSSYKKLLDVTFADYFLNKQKMVEDISEEKLYKFESANSYNDLILNITTAVFAFEMLSVKPSRNVVVQFPADNDENIKSAAFVLYNTARIATIHRKYHEKQNRDEYPQLVDISQIDFSFLNQEEEWKLIYNVILQYPEILHSAVNIMPKFDVSPHHVCSFIKRACHWFSVYYRKTRILMEGYPHLLPTIMTRLYLLKALDVVLRNSLRILKVDFVNYI